MSSYDDDRIPREWRKTFESLRNDTPVSKERLDRILQKIEERKKRPDDAPTYPGLDADIEDFNKIGGVQQSFTPFYLKVAASLLFVAGAFALFWGLLVQPNSFGAALITSVENGAYLKRNEEQLRIPGATPGDLKAGDILVLPNEFHGQVIVQCGNARMVFLPPSLVSFPGVDCKKNTARLYVSYGNITVFSRPLAGEAKHYVIASDRADYTLIGTELRLGVYHNSEFLQVVSGSVRVANRNGKAIIVNAGEGVEYDGQREKFSETFQLSRHAIEAIKDLLSDAPKKFEAFGAEWTEEQIKDEYGRIGTFYFIGEEDSPMRGVVFTRAGKEYVHLVGAGIVPINGRPYHIDFD